MPSANAITARNETACFTIPPPPAGCCDWPLHAAFCHVAGDRTYSLPFSGVNLKSCRKTSFARREVKVRPKPNCASPLLEERQVDRVCHGLVTGIIRVQMVAAVVSGKETRRMPRIAHHRIEVDHAIVRSAATDKLVHGLTLCFALRTEVGGSFKRGQRAAHDFESLLMRPRD